MAATRSASKTAGIDGVPMQPDMDRRKKKTHRSSKKTKGKGKGKSKGRGAQVVVTPVSARKY